MIILLVLGILATVGLWVFAAMIFRRVVPTNMVHIVQSRKKTTSYGSTGTSGNVYYQWPSWLPLIGVTVIRLPINNFERKLSSYAAYDKDRVPFQVDVTSFFRISNTNIAAQRIESISELNVQLDEIIQGAVRKVLASHDINRIMLERDTFGAQFTQEVEEQLAEWGVSPVKNMELMDIRDAQGSSVIANIMAIKQSEIEKTSREQVAENRKLGDIAEITAAQLTKERDLDAQRSVGEREAEMKKMIGIADEQAQQKIKEQAKITAEKDMAVKQVNVVREAEIRRDSEVVKANEDKMTQVIRAEGHLEATKREAEAIQVEGAAKAEAEKLMQLAPIQAQIELAKEIGNNVPYQQYLIAIEAVAAHKGIGMEQAQALVDADLKVIVNSGDTQGGVNGLMDLFTAKGGTNLAAMLEAVNQSDNGRELLKRIGLNIGENDAKPKSFSELAKSYATPSQNTGPKSDN
jgi:flotillin